MTKAIGPSWWYCKLPIFIGSGVGSGAKANLLAKSKPVFENVPFFRLYFALKIICISCSSISSSSALKRVQGAHLRFIHITNMLLWTKSIKAKRISLLHKQYTMKFEAKPSSSRLLAQARKMANPNWFLRSSVMKRLRKAAGVVQTTNKTTMTTRTITNIRSSGLCSPLFNSLSILLRLSFFLIFAFKSEANLWKKPHLYLERTKNMYV